MNLYYIDPTFTGTSNGSISAPYKSFSALKTAGFSHPCSIFIKRNTVMVDAVTFWAELNNTSGSMSYIGTYGQGAAPIWYKPNDSATHIYSSNTANITISGISFRTRNNQVTVGNGGYFLFLYLANSTKADYDANVWVLDCHFKTTEMNRTGQNGGSKMVYLCVRGDATGRVNKFGVKRSHFEDGVRAIQLQGLDNADDITDNSKGTYYSRGVLVEDCSFTGMSTGAVVMNCIESLNSAYTVDAYQSAVRRCYYSGYRWDIYNGTTISPDAVFWTYHCNRVMFEYLTGGGYQPTEADAEFIDFDGMSWDCVARYIVGYGNGASLLLISTDAQARAKYANYSSTYTEQQWYQTRRNGSGNNVLEFSLFFNNGVQRGYSLPGGYSTSCADVRITGFQYNIIVRNCVFIDSVSTVEKYIAHDSFASLNGTSVTFDSCAFIYKWLTTTDVISTTQTVAIPINFKNCSMSSLSWSTANTTTLATYLSNVVSSVTGMIYTDPGLVIFPTQPPASLPMAMKILPVPTSANRNAGSVTSTPDANGLTINDIWWCHLV